MIDPSVEELLSIPALAREVPPKGISVACAWRWALRGVRGRFLETLKVGDRRYSSREALARFMAACSAPLDRPQHSPGREKQILAAEKQLAEMGL